MAKSPRGLVVEPPAAPKAAVPEVELPTVELLGLSKVPRGWVVVAVSLQGEKVLDREVLSKDPEPKSVAAQRLLGEVVKQFIAPRAEKQ